MSIKLTANVNNPPISGLATAHLIKESVPIEIVWGNETSLLFPDNNRLVCHSNNDVLRALARAAPQYKLYGETAIEKTQIDHWLSFSLTCEDDISWALSFLDKSIAPVTFLVANKLTIADFALYNEMHSRYEFLVEKGIPTHVKRWYDLINGQELIQNALKSLPEEAIISSKMKKVTSNECDGIKPGERKREGKFVDLPGAEMGKVVVRFPPEASGYLHIGHAKAALLNQYYQQAFNGKLILRFDDTNPAKETVEFENVILGDVEMLQIKPDLFTHTSNYFDLMLKYCEQLMTDGKAYVDDTDPETMKQEREQRTESRNRSNSVEKNFAMWKEMLNGSEEGQKCCVRAKIDMSSANGCMRDPTIYRCKNEPHPRTGTKYKVYPTYDFACPIVDAIENVTHTLRTMEYHDRDDQFYWFIDALKLRKPYIWEYSRLNMTNTVLSKRKLTWFVDQGLVDGWDDPRLPTVRGIIRRGMTVEGLKEFIIAQGSSKSVVFMNWDKIWAFNKKIIDPIAPRYTALHFIDRVLVNVAGAKIETIEVPAHPKNASVGKKLITLGPEVFIEKFDAETLKEGENVTLINWGNIMINKINIHPEVGMITSIDATLNLEDKDFKKTLKLTWLAKVDEAEYPPTFCVYFDHIISKPVLAKDEDFKQYIGHKTREELMMLGDPALKNCKEGDIIQLQRRGFFRVDHAYAPPSVLSGNTSPVVLFSIPDGHTKDSPTSGQQIGKTAEEAIKSTSTPAPKIKKTVEKISENSNKNDIACATVGAESLDQQIAAQGEIVRNLKAKKGSKDEIDAEVKKLLSLKANYKSATGKDWKPSTTPPAVLPSSSPSISADEISKNITEQGEKVRQLKASKADKASIDTEVKVLLSHKADYKKLTGCEWKPKTSAVVVKTEKFPDPPADIVIEELNKKISSQGDKVRQAKTNKADKVEIEKEVSVLLALKSDYKSLTGSDWKPNNSNLTVSPPVTSNEKTEEANILEQIKSQGDKIRKLKSEKSPKAVIDPEIQKLLSLKEEYKNKTGKDWTPDTVQNKAISSAKMTESTLTEKDQLSKEISSQGEKVRAAKANNASKEQIDADVKKLLALKAKYKEITGTEYPTDRGKSSDPKEKKSKHSANKSATAKSQPATTNSALKKQTRLGLEATKEGNLSDWYSQVITKGELIEYYDVSGCYILRHWSFAIWKFIKNWFDSEITRMGVKECYFPIFVSKSALEREKTHIADFAPEVAWVTKSGDSELTEHIAVRPTSETVMYPAYAKWIQSYRDLPLRLNQWNNVVRWEFKHPQPFIRSREFLWQEGHTAFANKSEADKEVLDILDLYAQVYTHLLAIPVVKGRKTEKEKFAGSDYTTTVEAFISASGRAIQGATSHHLGQNFSKMFEIVFEDPETQTKKYVYQNSWGITTRTIGVMIMVHADNQGLVLPPHVASIQAIIVPCGITVNTNDDERDQLMKSCKDLENLLCSHGIRCEGDYRDNYSPGWKFNHWELKGVPLRIEIGPKDVSAKQMVAVRRDTGEKLILACENADGKIHQLLETIHESMLAKAKIDLTEHTKMTKNWAEFCNLLDQKNMLLTTFCGEVACEEKIKTDSARDEDTEPGAPAMGAKSLCIPFEQPSSITPTDKCIHPSCNRKPKFYTLFGRSY